MKTRKQLETKRRTQLVTLTNTAYSQLLRDPYAPYTVTREGGREGDIIIKFQGVLFRVQITRKRNQ